jgi:broad specificity phosphatase PhoE
MKHVFVLRHSQKDTNGDLTVQGIEEAKLLRKVLPEFNIVIASDSSRTQETAQFLTGVDPQIDMRAGFYDAPKKTSDEINIQAISNPFGFTGAFLGNEEIQDKIIEKAQELVNLIFETLDNLNTNENALIVSHDITMVPAVKIITNKLTVQSFKYLSGYIIDGDKKLTLFP